MLHCSSSTNQTATRQSHSERHRSAAGPMAVASGTQRWGSFLRRFVNKQSMGSHGSALYVSLVFFLFYFNLFTFRKPPPSAKMAHGIRAHSGTVTMGSVYSEGTGGKTCNVDKIIIHPNWNPAASGNDVALIQMDCTVDFTSDKHSKGCPISSDTINSVCSCVYGRKNNSTN
jgi:hypothetical protein